MNTAQKTKSTAKWTTLTQDQRDQVESWLFEKHYSYTDALARARQDFGFEGSRASLQRFAVHLKHERMTRTFEECARLTANAEGKPRTTAELQAEAVKLASQRLLILMATYPGEPRCWIDIARWVGQMARIDATKQIERSRNELVWEKIRLERRKFEHDVIETGVNALKELQAVADARKEPRVRVLEYNRRMNRVRRRVFGNNIPDILPETEAELDAAEEAKRRQEEEEEAYHNKLVAEYTAEQAAKGLDFHGNPLPPAAVQAEVGTSRCDVLPQEPSSSTESAPSASASDASRPEPNASGLSSDDPVSDNSAETSETGQPEPAKSKDLTEIDRIVSENIGTFSSDEYTDDQVDKDNQALGMRLDVKISRKRRRRI